MNYLWGIFNETWKILNGSSLYLLIGFFIAGLVYVFITSDNVIKYFGKGKITSVIMASLIGLPLPLCSCGVIPTAAALRKKGANKGATVSFLISTPESDITSIAVTYGLMDIIMTIARPIAALFTAIFSGIFTNLMEKEQVSNIEIDASCIVDNCCDGIDCPPEIHHYHHSVYQKVFAGMKYSFDQLLADISNWLLFGFVLAGIISYLVPTSIISNYFGASFHSKFLMLIIGIPVYICASASTPIVAALILKGMSPGTALVFLMAGPATNIASIGVIIKIIGKKATAIYIFSICICSILLGYLLDLIYVWLNVSPMAIVSSMMEEKPSVLNIVSTIVLLSLIFRIYFKKYFGKKKNSCDKCCS